MTYFAIAGCAVLAMAALVTPVRAEQDFPFLAPDAVRSAYDQAREEWQETPDMVRQVFRVAEDRRFFDRPPLRSMITSSLTSWYPEPGGQRSLAVSAAIARALSRDEILDWFVHGIFLGQGCFGVDGAAAAYFGKQTSELALHETALPAALVPAPARLHPVRSPDRALERRNFVLGAAAKVGVVPAQEAEAAKARPLSVRVPLGTCSPKTE